MYLLVWNRIAPWRPVPPGQLELTWEQLQEVADDKRARRGGFRRRVFLDYVDQPE